MSSCGPSNLKHPTSIRIHICVYSIRKWHHTVQQQFPSQQAAERITTTVIMKFLTTLTAITLGLAATATAARPRPSSCSFYYDCKCHDDATVCRSMRRRRKRAKRLGARRIIRMRRIISAMTRCRWITAVGMICVRIRIRIIISGVGIRIKRALVVGRLAGGCREGLAVAGLLGGSR
ncbi:hypothetical protein EJ03DRAFT_25974 [Teratosphaeria nubilosa]|uniref:Uncharacterized protein n=1 Tax=Teratosphaeria nubilosa TaxID=161662 RepID=A0A6G1KVA0_9PEZI|nr:hypothetical protein EJ03DRAFT_25974 [Teratosphaeria nubilosa]